MATARITHKRCIDNAGIMYVVIVSDPPGLSVLSMGDGELFYILPFFLELLFLC